MSGTSAVPIGEPTGGSADDPTGEATGADAGRSRTTRGSRGTHRLLLCGAASGPILVAVTGAQILTRKGFDLRRHGISLLSLGDRGWIQIVNFVLAGILSVAFGQGVRRVLAGRQRLMPVLISGYGAGLIATGRSWSTRGRLPRRHARGRRLPTQLARRRARRRAAGGVRLPCRHLFPLRPPVRRNGQARVGGLLGGDRADRGGTDLLAGLRGQRPLGLGGPAHLHVDHRRRRPAADRAARRPVWSFVDFAERTAMPLRDFSPLSPAVRSEPQFTRWNA